MNLWKTEFGPDYVVPNEISTHPLMEDTSWGNDACPTFTLKSQVESNSPNDLNLVLWVEHPNPEFREVMTKRYFVSNGQDDVLETDDTNEAIAKFEELAKQISI